MTKLLYKNLKRVFLAAILMLLFLSCTACANDKTELDEAAADMVSEKSDQIPDAYSYLFPDEAIVLSEEFYPIPSGGYISITLVSDKRDEDLLAYYYTLDGSNDFSVVKTESFGLSALVGSNKFTIHSFASGANNNNQDHTIQLSWIMPQNEYDGIRDALYQSYLDHNAHVLCDYLVAFNADTKNTNKIEAMDAHALYVLNELTYGMEKTFLLDCLNLIKFEDGQPYVVSDVLDRADYGTVLLKEKYIPENQPSTAMDSLIMQRLYEFGYSNAVLCTKHSSTATFAGDATIEIKKAIPTENNEIIAIGITNSDKGDIVREHTGKQVLMDYENLSDVWVAKLDSDLNIVWEKCINEQLADDRALDIVDEGNGVYKVVYIEMEAEFMYQEEGEDIYSVNAGVKMTACEINDMGEILSYEEITQWQGNELFDWYELYRPNSGVSVSVSPYWIGSTVYFEILRPLSIGDYVPLSPTWNMIETPDGGYLLLGQVYDEPYSDFGITGMHFTTEEIFREKYQQYCHTGNKDEPTDYEFNKFDFCDELVIKLDKCFKMEWYRYCGGTGFDQIYSIYIGDAGEVYFEGKSYSQDGDIVGWRPGVYNEYLSDTFYTPKKAPWAGCINNKGELVYSELYHSNFSVLDESLYFETDDAYYGFRNDYYDTGDSAEWTVNEYVTAYKVEKNHFVPEEITGEYQGDYKNTSGGMSLTVTLSNVHTGTIYAFVDADIHFSPIEGNKDGKEGEYLASGYVDLITGEIILIGEAWVGQPPEGYEMLNLKGKITGDSFVGEFDRDYLKGFKLNRDY